MPCPHCSKELSAADFGTLVRFLVGQPRLREQRTGDIYVPTGLGPDGLRLSRLDGSKHIVVGTLDNFEITREED